MLFERLSIDDVIEFGQLEIYPVRFVTEIGYGCVLLTYCFAHAAEWSLFIPSLAPPYIPSITYEICKIMVFKKSKRQIQNITSSKQKHSSDTTLEMFHHDLEHKDQAKNWANLFQKTGSES